ncbi:MAG TPA: bifunctional methylenetetrahydrofolate dehydrogenase/methenyltetrahydrofolate cyclohydrolase FolD [Candidatus Moranbacteria bacterium]|nr:bifunctional methylenetetrahydrofolate dehydrogenase/methenyltetrahydrofolate cyclohydrolase FolD [Candidatus Moranbacteria bacterium]
MSAKILDGKKLASEIKEELKIEIAQLKKTGIAPGLVVILVGDDPASKIYVDNKKKACEEMEINSQVFEMPECTTEEELLKLIQKLNADEKTHGILVQLPLPKHIDEGKIIESIDPKKDVDCFHPENVGKLSIGIGKLLPCTPAGIMEILKRNNIEISGRECVVAGKSNIVGKPMAMMFLEENATVIVAHIKTENLGEITKRADILVTAVGKAGLIKKDMIKKGVVVVDVGMNRLSNGKLVGDADFENVKEIASAITPVPGGVGPMTVAMLMKNTVETAKRLYKNNLND